MDAKKANAINKLYCRYQGIPVVVDGIRHTANGMYVDIKTADGSELTVPASLIDISYPCTHPAVEIVETCDDDIPICFSDGDIIVSDPNPHLAYKCIVCGSILSDVPPFEEPPFEEEL